MNLLDVIILIIVPVGFILGFKDGIIRKLLGLAGLILGVYMAVFFAGRLGNMIETSFGLEPYFADIVAGSAIFFSIVLIFSILKRIIHPFDKVNNFTNQILGGIVGALQILFFASAVLFLLKTFDVPKQQIREESFFYHKVYRIIPATVGFVSTYTPADNDTLRYIIKN